MKIFISYRHSEGIAGEVSLIHKRLVEEFGAACVFLDSGVLAVGDPFPEMLQAGLATCKVFLVLIDPQWIASADRLHDSADWVRREVETALRRRADDGIRVIPVLLSGAAMPNLARLPASLAVLADLHATPLRGATLDDDLELLVQRLIGRRTWKDLELWLQARRQALLWVALGLVLLFCASVVALFDKMNLETGLEALTLAWADVFEDPAPNEQLVTVVIDKATLEKLGKEDFDRSWRKEHAQLIRNLADAGASVVAFDIYLAGTSDFDRDLVEAIEAARRKNTRVVFGTPSPKTPGPVLPSGSVDLGLLCMGTELDWSRLAPLVVRRPLVPAAAASAAEQWQYLTSFGASVAKPRLTVSEIDVKNRQVLGQVIGQDLAGKPFRLAFSRSESVKDEQTCDVLQKGDEVAQTIVRFTRLDRLRESVRRSRYEELCCDPAGSAAMARYRGKIVLIGSELDARDIRQVSRGLRTEERFGYEIHADVINTLLDKVDIQAVSPLPQFLVMLAMGLLGMLARFWPPLWKPVRGRLFACAVPVAYLVFCAWLCAEFHLLLNGVYHLAAFVVAYVVSGLLLRSKGLLTPRGI